MKPLSNKQMSSSFHRPKEWARKRKLQKFWLKFRFLGPSEPRNFSPKFCNFLLRTHSFGLRKLEVICLFESGFILKFWFQVVFKHSSFYRGRFWHENVAFWVRRFEIVPYIYIYKSVQVNFFMGLIFFSSFNFSC